VCAYKKHPLVVVANSNAQTKDIILFANNIQQEVKEKTNIEIFFEVRLVQK